MQLQSSIDMSFRGEVQERVSENKKLKKLHKEDKQREMQLKYKEVELHPAPFGDVGVDNWAIGVEVVEELQIQKKVDKQEFLLRYIQWYN